MSDFAKKLQELAGEEEVIFILPGAFLPPRYLSESKGRNLLVCVDTDLSISTRWEGSRIQEFTPLSPGRAARLVEEVLDRLPRYAKDGLSFSGWLRENGTLTEIDAGLDDPSSRRVDVAPPLRSITASVKTPDAASTGAGGESPMPGWSVDV